MSSKSNMKDITILLKLVDLHVTKLVNQFNKNKQIKIIHGTYKNDKRMIHHNSISIDFTNIYTSTKYCESIRALF